MDLSGPAFEKDLRQRNALEALGWRVLHVTKQMFNSGVWLGEVGAVILSQSRLLALEAGSSQNLVRNPDDFRQAAPLAVSRGEK